MKKGKIVVIANQKGGVGKTTTAVNLSAALALAEKKVLLIDLDPQGNATSGVGVNIPDKHPTSYELIIKNAHYKDCALATELEFLWIIPANISLVGAEIELVPLISREKQLAGALVGVRDEYDWIIIDSPPSLGLLTLNALSACDTVLIPIQAEYYALEGLTKLLNTIRLVKRHINPELEIQGAVVTMYDPRLNLSRQVREDVIRFFKGKVYETCIHRSVKLSEAPSHGKPIFLYDITSRGAKNYMALAEEMLLNEN
ncbi:MAG: AAA family ATPase [bacterium]|nr:AAA family ATPase [bacterium]